MARDPEAEHADRPAQCETLPSSRLSRHAVAAGFRRRRSSRPRRRSPGSPKRPPSKKPCREAGRSRSQPLLRQRRPIHRRGAHRLADETAQRTRRHRSSSASPISRRRRPRRTNGSPSATRTDQRRQRRPCRHLRQDGAGERGAAARRASTTAWPRRSSASSSRARPARSSARWTPTARAGSPVCWRA